YVLLLYYAIDYFLINDRMTDNRGNFIIVTSFGVIMKLLLITLLLIMLNLSYQWYILVLVCYLLVWHSLVKICLAQGKYIKNSWMPITHVIMIIHLLKFIRLLNWRIVRETVGLIFFSTFFSVIITIPFLILSYVIKQYIFPLATTDDVTWFVMISG